MSFEDTQKARYYGVENYTQLGDIEPMYTVNDAIMQYEDMQRDSGMNTEWDDLEAWQKVWYIDKLADIVERLTSNMQYQISDEIPGLIFHLSTLAKERKELEELRELETGSEQTIYLCSDTPEPYY